MDNLGPFIIYGLGKTRVGLEALFEFNSSVHKEEMERVTEIINNYRDDLLSENLSISHAKHAKQRIRVYNEERKRLELEINEARQGYIGGIILCIETINRLKSKFNGNDGFSVDFNNIQQELYNLIPQNYFLPTSEEKKE